MGPWVNRRWPDYLPKGRRGPFDVDRDRVIHCETFRELQDKTQVQAVVQSPARSSFRTRLNHVIEVAQLAGALARELGLDQTLAEAVALAHDLGHPPFGHAGERALRTALTAHGAPEWNANVHSLTVVDMIESTFIDFPGLNLTWAAREGIARHSTPFDDPVSFGEFVSTPQGGAECQIVDAADVLAYLSHDLDDALADEFIGLSELVVLSPLLDDLIQQAERLWSRRKHNWPDDERPRLVRRFVVANLLGASIADYREASEAAVGRLAVHTAEDVRMSSERIIVASESFEALTSDLLRLLTERYYRSPAVQESDALAEQTIRGLFEWYVEHSDEIPERFRVDGVPIAAATYIASLNDRSATVRANEIGIAATFPLGESAR